MITQLNRTAMQDDIIMNETEYIEGFNMGYRMTKEFPELAEFLSYAHGNNDKLEGLKDGRSQYVEEQLEKKAVKTKEEEVKSKLLWLDKSKTNTKNKLNDRSKGIEPEL